MWRKPGPDTTAARGDATKKSDIDILVITKSNDWKRVDQIREIGYDMDNEIDYKFSIQVLPKSHIDYLRSKNFHFAKIIDTEGVWL